MGPHLETTHNVNIILGEAEKWANMTIQKNDRLLLYQDVRSLWVSFSEQFSQLFKVINFREGKSPVAVLLKCYTVRIRISRTWTFRSINLRNNDIFEQKKGPSGKTTALPEYKWLQEIIVDWICRSHYGEDHISLPLHTIILHFGVDTSTNHFGNIKCTA